MRQLGLVLKSMEMHCANTEQANWLTKELSTIAKALLQETEKHNATFLL